MGSSPFQSHPKALKITKDGGDAAPKVILFLAGHANGHLKGNLHVKVPDGTPMANVFLTLMRRLGMDVQNFGDSTGEVDI